MDGEAIDPSRSFGGDAEAYDRARPSYPEAAIQRLGTRPGMGVVDVGCGTGALSRLLVARGCEVVGVEPDERMAAIAVQHGLVVERSAFEDWDARGRRFDAVVAGMSWHWVDPGRGAAKAASVLEHGGVFAALWNHAALPPDVREAILPAYERHAPTLPSTALILSGSNEVTGPDDDAEALRATGFVDVRREAVEWPHRYTTATWIDELGTRSSHRVLDPQVRAALLDEVATAVDDRLGGSFDVTYRTTMLLARRASGAP